VVGKGYAIYHDLPLRLEKYSYDKAQSAEVVGRLKKLYASRGKKKFIKDVVE
jgi:hypothetical protein